MGIDGEDRGFLPVPEGPSVPPAGGGAGGDASRRRGPHSRRRAGRDARRVGARSDNPDVPLDVTMGAVMVPGMKIWHG